nr:MAG TPA: hypothetical protein [Caudoviricetes sp.]
MRFSRPLNIPDPIRIQNVHLLLLLTKVYIPAIL